MTRKTFLASILALICAPFVKRKVEAPTTEVEVDPHLTAICYNSEGQWTFFKYPCQPIQDRVINGLMARKLGL